MYAQACTHAHTADCCATAIFSGLSCLTRPPGRTWLLATNPAACSPCVAPCTPHAVPDVEQTEKLLHGVAGVQMLLRPGRDGSDGPSSDWTTPNSPGLSGIHWHPKSMGCIVETAQHIPSHRWMYVLTGSARLGSRFNAFCSC